jgi:hypothetical protein
MANYHAQIQILLKCARITIELHIILNFLLQHLLSDTNFTMKSYILRFSNPSEQRK